MYVSLCETGHQEYIDAHEGPEGIGFPGNGVTDGCEPSDVSARN